MVYCVAFNISSFLLLVITSNESPNRQSFYSAGFMDDVMNVIIRNKTKGNVVAENSVVCRSLMSKARGLMFRREAIPMIFEFCSMQRNALHMMFVFFPIDAIFLDDNRKVVEIKKNFRPFRYHSPKKKSMYVIELSAGTVVSKNIQIGDMMNWR